MADEVMSLKLLVNSHGKKVMFAEVGKDFVDFLFHILSLPLANVISLLREQGRLGSLTNLYESIENLNDSYIQPNQSKKNLLNPRVSGVSHVPLLALQAAPSTVKVYFTCSNCSSKICKRCSGGFMNSSDVLFNSSFGNSNSGLFTNSSNCTYRITDDPSTACPDCHHLMNTNVKYFAPSKVQKTSGHVKGGFVKDVVTYMVMDDLVVSPMSTISSITLLNKFNVKDVGALEEKVVKFGIKEALKLLHASLHSTKVLTDVFIGSI